MNDINVSLRFLLMFKAQEERQTLLGALTEWSTKTCLRFRSPTQLDRMMQRQFVLIRDGSG